MLWFYDDNGTHVGLALRDGFGKGGFWVFGFSVVILNWF